MTKAEPGLRVEWLGKRGTIRRVYTADQCARGEPSADVDWDDGQWGLVAIDGRLMVADRVTVDDVAEGWA